MENYKKLTDLDMFNTSGGGISATQCALAIGRGIAGGIWKGGVSGIVFGGAVGTVVGAHIGAIGDSFVCIGGLLG